MWTLMITFLLPEKSINQSIDRTNLSDILSRNSNGKTAQRDDASFIFNYCIVPAVFGHFSPAPVKTDRAVRIQ